MSLVWRKLDTTFLLRRLSAWPGPGSLLRVNTCRFKGIGFVKGDKEGKESKGAEKGKILPSTGESLGKSLLVPKLPSPPP